MSLLDDFAKFEEEAKEIEKKTEELKKEIKKEPIKRTITIPKKKREDKYQKQIDNITKQIENLTKKLDLSKIDKKDNSIDDFIKYFNFGNVRKEIIRDHNLKPLDIFVITKKGRKPLFWDLARIRKDHPEYCKDREEFFFVQFLNRMERDGKKYIEFIIEYCKKRLNDFTENKPNMIKNK